MMTFGTRLFTMFHGSLVGQDNFGNQYYQLKRAPKDGRRRTRWVVYRGMAEPSKIPSMWNAWLHYTINEFPSPETLPNYAWIKEHVPNLTGTAVAYVPAGHIKRGAERPRSTSDYSAWTPGGEG